MQPYTINERSTLTSADDRRGWLASLLLRQPERFLPRLAAAAGQWRALPRRLRRRLQRNLAARKIAARKIAATTLGAALLLALSGAAFHAQPVHAAAINVVDGYVLAADDGACSLREAIRNANTDTQQFSSPGECEAGSGDDVIILPDGGYFPLYNDVAYVGLSETGLPSIASTITIEGNGSTIHRALDNPGLNFRLMAVVSSGDLTLNNVTFSNGYAIGLGGGALYNQGTATINESTFLNNNSRSFGGAITNGGYNGSGNLEINDSYFFYNRAAYHGGAVRNDNGSVTISGTTISENNSGRSGGGIYHRSGSLTLIDSVVTLNENVHDGAGIFSNGGTVIVTDSEISYNKGNRDGGGLFSNDGTVTITDSDIYYNTANRDGAGLFSNGGVMTIITSDISHNQSIRDGGGVLSNNGTTSVTDSGITYNSGGRDGGGVFIRAGTFTLAGSEISDNTALRGGGAFQADGIFDIDDSTISDNDTTSGSGGGIAVIGGALEMNDSTLSGNQTVGGGGGGLRVEENGTAEIYDSTITHNRAGQDNSFNSGGGIHNDGDLTIVRSTIDGNTATGSGGGILTEQDMRLVNSTVSNNSAGQHGGGIRVVFNKVTVENSTLILNTAGSYGGGISQSGILPPGLSGDTAASIDLLRSIISGNEAGTGKEMDGIYTEYIHLDYTVIGREGIGFGQAFPNYSLGPSNFNATDSGTPTPLGDILDTTLADNGGPTLTHLLVEGSPALDLAPSAECAAGWVDGRDQRGEPRNLYAGGSPGDYDCDAGAVEGTVAIVDPPVIFLSTRTAGSAGGVSFGNEDILQWTEGVWSMWFDGSAALLDTTNKPKHNINAFWIPDAEEHDVVMSFAQQRRFVEGIPFPVDGMDLVWWDGDDESFSFWFDGSDVGLTKKTPEKIDALHVLDGDEAPINDGNCEAYLLISTQGPGKAPNYGGGTLKFGGEDVLGFCATGLGEDTAGHWHMVLDGSAVGLPKNSLDSISVDGDTIYFTTSKPVKLPGGPAGGHSTVYAYNISTGEFTGPFFKAAENGLGLKMDGLQMN